jgi:signal transduction histidine kinase
LKNAAKTQKQLIAELETLEQENAKLRQLVHTSAVSVVQRQLAVERVRAAAMDMRATGDLRHVVAVVCLEMRRLGIETMIVSIDFVDESADEVRHYYSSPHPRLAGLDWSPDQAPHECVVDGDLVVQGGLYGPVDTFRKEHTGTMDWESGATRTFEDEFRTEPWGRQAVGLSREDEKTYHKLFQGHWFVTNVPFRFGMIGYRELEHHPEHDEIVAELARGLELGFLRFLDFQQLEQANLNKSQFLRRMSHDLRSPMNAIIGYSRLLQRSLGDRMDEREARNLANIQTSSHNLLNLINDILDLSRIEAGRIEMNVQPVDVRTLAGECADALESIVREGVVLRRELEDVGTIRSDGDRLRQVVMNLLGNATKFTGEGSITLSLRRVDGAVELSIADTGIGIPPEDLPHIFDEFRQVERQDGEQTEGTGLGLAIVKKTVELLGGKISAKSAVGKGTTFTLRVMDYGAK